MTDDRPDPVAEGQSGGDIEYDLAHEALADSGPMSHEREGELWSLWHRPYRDLLW